MASDTVPVLRLANHATLPGNPGGKLSKASDGQITSRATRLSRPMSVRNSAPPQSVTTSVTSVRSSASRKSPTMCDHAGQRQVGVVAHRDAVPAHRQHRQQVAVIARQVGQRQVPLRVVHQQSVQENHRRAGRIAFLAVFDGPGGDVDGFHGDPSALER